MIIWKKNIGRIHSKNNILAYQGRIIVGTCGHHWNIDDDEDGVSALDSSTGELIWFAATGCDVNEICRAGQSFLCPTDSGRVFVIDAALGKVTSILTLDSAVLSKPLVWHYDDESWEATIVSASGTVYRLGPNSGDLVVIGALGEPVRANLVGIGPPTEKTFIVATESGHLIRCELAENHFTTRVLARVTYKDHARSKSNLEVEKTGAIYAAPAFSMNRLYVGFCRDSYYSAPPLLCLDPLTGKEIWRAPLLTEGHYGNCRVTPAVAGPYLVSAFAYADCIHISDKENGMHVATIKIGKHVYQQWSAPVLHDEDQIILGRVDGCISIVDLKGQKLVASFSLATCALSLGPIAEAEQDRTYALSPRRRPLGICGTPTVVGHRIFAGTTTGDLFAIDLGVLRHTVHSSR